mmetsp:Transcript_104916/g.295428  ORF Transcript_104916/g.295428 Transcript_104916/m.295428 type:complete len:265 (-) Transcript_104916:264-1058(-)
MWHASWIWSSDGAPSAVWHGASCGSACCGTDAPHAAQRPVWISPAASTSGPGRPSTAASRLLSGARCIAFWLLRCAGGGAALSGALCVACWLCHNPTTWGDDSWREHERACGAVGRAAVCAGGCSYRVADLSGLVPRGSYPVWAANVCEWHVLTDGNAEWHFHTAGNAEWAGHARLRRCTRCLLGSACRAGDCRRACHVDDHCQPQRRDAGASRRLGSLGIGSGSSGLCGLDACSSCRDDDNGRATAPTEPCAHGGCAPHSPAG